MNEDVLNILFLGDGNAHRSKLAEAMLRAHLGSELTVTSAGLEAGTLHEHVETVLKEDGLELSELEPRAIAELDWTPFDLIVTLSDKARRACTAEERVETGGDVPLNLHIGTPMRLHWALEAPSIAGDTSARLAALRLVRDQVREHVTALLEQGYLESLTTERRRARMLVDAIDTGIVVHDERRRIYLFNSAAERITGRSKQDVLGHDCHEVFAPDGICGSHCAFQKGIAEPFERREYKVAFTSADGTGRLVRMLSSPMLLHKGRPAEVVAQVTDVTEIDSLRWRMKEKNSLHGMVGDSTAMRGVFEIIRQVASSDYPVLITGESGTGKELAARAIHAESRRSEGPFVPINCGALPEHILESELFGHVRGAFTGAIRDKKGRFELANNGTIFLDEVGELTPSFQVKLLRVLQEMRFERVGGERTIDVDVRVISATNRDLRQMVQRREFREDLFYRLCVVPITLPPLRERRPDIPLLVSNILGRIQEEMNRPDLTLAGSTLDLLMNHRWPGNVRELINALQFAAVRCSGHEISAEHVPPEVRQGLAAFAPSPHSSVSFDGQLTETPRSRKKLDMDTVLAALAQTGGNKVQAAKLLGVGRATLYRFLSDNPLPDSIKKIP